MSIKMKFARFGGLSSVKQKGYDASMPGFHSPPSKRGIYVFVYPYYIPFLLGAASYSGFKSKHNKLEYVKDRLGNFEIEPPYDPNDNSPYVETNFMTDFGTMEREEGVFYKVKLKKPKIFEYTGQIWHHLGDNLKPGQILQIKGSWYLSDYVDYVEAFDKERHKLKRDTAADMTKWGDTKNFKELAIRGDFGWYNTDHLEVFIEKV